MVRRTIRRGIVVAVLLAVAAILLPPFVNVGRYKGRVTESMSNALGRPVTCDSIELRLFPQPGFYMENVAIGDDPAYSAEPILHAEEVTAYIGLSSLWRGHMEIAGLKFNYPSLNLVERPDASWNLESLLWKVSRTKAAPTAAPRSGSRSRFPYIEATNGRINFKYGLEKSVFSFTDADFTLFSPSEDHWRMRIEAHPVRTDMPVTDTGTFKAEVNMQRAEFLRDAPMKATVTWERVQLGNLTRLIFGADRGWRGALEASAQFSGTPSALHFTTAARLREFRRFDVNSDESPTLNATCQGLLNVGDNQLSQSECRLPLEGGVLSVQGTMRGLRSPRYDLVLSAEDLGANALLNIARRAKHNLPDDLSATGTVSASFHASRLTDAPSAWIGNLEMNGLALHSAVLGKDLVVGRAVAMVNTTALPSAPRGSRRNHSSQATAPVRALVLQSFNLPLGASAPAVVDGALNGDHFSIHIKGDATLERLQQFARAVGIGAPKIALSGPASVDLTIGGPWDSFDSPELSGSAQIKNARAEVPGISLPLEIASARVGLARERFTVSNASATVGKIVLGGYASFPRSCDAYTPCESGFELTIDDFNPERWNEVLNPHLKKKPWYRLFGAQEDAHNVLATLHGSGRIVARHFTLGPVSGSAFQTAFSIANGVLQLKDTHAVLLGGSVSGDWKIDFTGPVPSYESSGTASGIQADKLTSLLKASLGSGTLGLGYKLQMSGWDAAALSHSATVETDFTWNGGALRISPDGKSPLRIFAGEGKAALGKDGWTISASKWNTPAGVYQITGTASRDSALALVFTQPNGAVWKVSGTLPKPQTSATAPMPMQARR